MKPETKVALILACHPKKRDGQVEESSGTRGSINQLRRFLGAQKENNMLDQILQEMCSRISSKMDDIRARRRGIEGDYAEFAGQSRLLDETALPRFNSRRPFAEYPFGGWL